MKFLQIILVIFLLSSCADPAKEIIGGWQRVRGVHHGEEEVVGDYGSYPIEFKPDGQLIHRTAESDFKILSSVLYRLNMDSSFIEIKEHKSYSSESDYTRVYFELDGDVLLLKQSKLYYAFYVREGSDSTIWQEVRTRELDLLPRNEKRDVRDNLVEDNNEFWLSQQASRARYPFQIQFHPVAVAFQFLNGQTYEYRSYMSSDSTIVMIWPPDQYAKTLDLQFDTTLSNYLRTMLIEGTDPPQKGADFATFILKDRNTFEVHYNYPEWVAGVNRLAGDSLFPNYVRFAGRK
ncbi:MAG: hypothetical protein ACKVOK_14060 [Flavobacteriales bacterium]